MRNNEVSPIISAPDAEHAIANLLNQRSFSAASDMLSGIALKASKDPRVVGQYLFLPALDKLVERLSRELLDGNEEATASPSSGKIPVIIATELYVDGGHSRIVEDLIKVHGGGLVILTNYFAGSSRPPNILPAAIGNLPILVLPLDSAENNILRLHRLCDELASQVYLLAHHHDAVAYAAVCSNMRAPVFFIHHSDHKPTLGATIPSLRHVHMGRHMIEFCTKHTGHPVLYWPQGVTDHGRKKFNYPISEACTASAGSMHKFAWEGPLRYPLLVRTLLQSGTCRHFHIGNLPDNRRLEIEAELERHAIAKDRFTYVGQVPSVWQCLLGLPVNVVVGSAPTHGLRTSIEVQGAGIPYLPYLQNSESSMNDRNFYNKSTSSWATTEELITAIKNTLASHQEICNEARAHYEGSYSTRSMLDAINLSMTSS